MSVDLETYIDGLHDKFIAEFVETRTRFLDRNVLVPRRTDRTGRLEKFFHLVTASPDGKYDEDDRNVDSHRCERLCWLKPVLEDAPSDRVRVWKDSTRGEVRYGASLTDFSYVIHVAERKEYFQLITAYCVEGKRRRERFEEQWRRDMVR